jgi:hypothetical protein
MMVASGLVLLFAFWAGADVSDFETKAEINVGGQPSALGVSLDDRFVFAADKDNNRLVIIDTWNWRVVNPLGSDTVLISGEPVGVAVSRTGKYVYISRTDGLVSQFDISGLSELDFNGELSELAIPVTEEGFTVSDSDTLGEMAVILQEGATNVDCVFVVVEQGSTHKLTWHFIKDAGVQDSGTAIFNVQNIELSAGKDVVFAKYKDDWSNNYLNVYKGMNPDIPIQEIDIFDIDDGYTLSGLAVDPNQYRLVIGDVDNTKLHLFDVQDIWFISVFPSDSTTITDAPSELLFSDFSKEPNPIVWASSAEKLNGAEVNDGLTVMQFSGGYETAVSFSSTVTALAQSSTVDACIYALAQGSETVFVVTANPWVSDVQTIPGGTIEGDTVTVKFSYDKGDSYTIRRVEGFKEAGTQIASEGLSGGDTVKSIDLSTEDLEEGRNILSVEVTDSVGRKGWNAVELQVDLAPSPLDFDLDFGDEKLIISFRAHDLPDLDYYEIYYGTNGSVPEDQYEEIDDTGKMGDPGSPFKISDPEPKKKYEKVITGLKNGDRYYAQIITADDSGNISISDRKSAVPQPVRTLTDLAEEDGGFDCFEQIGPSEGALSFIWLLILPILVAGMLRVLLRVIRS